MRIFGAFGALLLPLVLGGCNGDVQLNPLAEGPKRIGPSGQGLLRSIRGYPTAALYGSHVLHVDHSRSRMDRVDRRPGNQLLYISDQDAWDVQVYNYPSDGTQKSPAGTLAGFTDPQGECSDKAHRHVFVTNTGAAEIWEFAYGATSPAAQLIDPYAWPVGCAVDPTTGNLAVTSLFSWSSGPGSVSLYRPPFKNLEIPAETYSDPELKYMYFATYTKTGDLFVDGFTNDFGLVELKKGSSAFTTITISNSVGAPGGVNYDAKKSYLDVTDQEYQTTYGYSVTGTTATLEQTTPMTGACDVVQTTLTTHLNGIVGPDACNVNADTYKYPSGGSPEPHRIITANLYSPIGSAILKP